MDYAASVLAKGQAVVTQRNQEPEQRRKAPTVMELALKNQVYSIPNAPDLRKSPNRPVEITYFKNVAPGNGTTKAYNHTGNYGDTGVVELVYITHVETITLPRKIAFNNIVTYTQMFSNQYEMKWKNLRTRHDNSALSFLLQNRVQLNAATMNPQLASANPGTWNDTNFALEVSQGNRSRFMQRIKSAMNSRLFTGELDVVADLQMTAEFEFFANQKENNAVNTGFQYGGAGVASTQDVVDVRYPNGAVLALPRYMFSGMYWNEGLNKQGVNQDIGGPVGTLGTVADPFGSGAVADISMYTKRGDTSANTTGGSTQDIIDEYELALTIAYALPPLSAAGDSVVMEIVQSA